MRTKEKAKAVTLLLPALILLAALLIAMVLLLGSLDK